MKGLTFAFTRYVDNHWIDREKSPNIWGGKPLPMKSKSPSGLYPCIIVPTDLVGRKVQVIPISNEDTPLSMEALADIKKKIYGIRISCFDDTQSIVELEWETETNDSREIFKLINGVTGYESFYIDNDFSNLKLMSQRGWRANVGTKGSYDALVIPANQMKIVYDYLIYKKEHKNE